MRHPNEVVLHQRGVGALPASIVPSFPVPEGQLSPEGFVLWAKHFDGPAAGQPPVPGYEPLSQAHRQVYLSQYQAQAEGSR